MCDGFLIGEGLRGSHDESGVLDIRSTSSVEKKGEGCLMGIEESVYIDGRPPYGQDGAGGASNIVAVRCPENGGDLAIDHTACVGRGLGKRLTGTASSKLLGELCRR